jgi:hypothetical protein
MVLLTYIHCLGDPRFSFLDPSHIFHAYYRERMRDLAGQQGARAGDHARAGKTDIYSAFHAFVLKICAFDIYKLIPDVFFQLQPQLVLAFVLRLLMECWRPDQLLRKELRDPGLERPTWQLPYKGWQMYLFHPALHLNPRPWTRRNKKDGKQLLKEARLVSHLEEYLDLK